MNDEQLSDDMYARIGEIACTKMIEGFYRTFLEATEQPLIYSEQGQLMAKAEDHEILMIISHSVDAIVQSVIK